MRLCQRCVVAAMGLLLALPNIAQDRLWVKSHHQLDMDEEPPEQWTTISTADKQFPAKTRLLFRDADARRLVIRFEADSPSTSEIISLNYLETGETMSLTVTDSAIEVTLGAQVYSLPRADCEAYSGPNGTDCPPNVRAEAAAFIAAASPEFRDALLDFVRVGCTASMELFFKAARVGWVFFSDQVDCTKPPLNLVSKPTKVVPNFDPAAEPPDEFDFLFGEAYFQ